LHQIKDIEEMFSPSSLVLVIETQRRMEKTIIHWKLKGFKNGNK